MGYNYTHGENVMMSLESEDANNFTIKYTSYVEPRLSLNATAVLLICMTVVGVPANALVVVVSLLSPFKHSVSSVYIGNLACADLLFLSISPVWVWFYIRRSWPLGRVLCYICSISDQYTFYISVFFLIVISVDRYIAVVWPFAALRLRTITRARVVAVAVWLFAAVPTLFIHFNKNTIYTSNDNGENCHSYLDFDNLQSLVFTVLAFFLPLLFLGTITTITASNLMCRRSMCPQSSISKHHHSLCLLVAVVVVFFICWFPLQFITCTRGLMEQTALPFSASTRKWFHHLFSQYINLTVCLIYLNCCINPFLYAFVGHFFRESFKILWQRHCPCLIYGKVSQTLQVKVKPRKYTEKTNHTTLPFKTLLHHN